MFFQNSIVPKNALARRYTQTAILLRSITAGEIGRYVDCWESVGHNRS